MLIVDCACGIVMIFSHIAKNSISFSFVIDEMVCKTKILYLKASCCSVLVALFYI